MRTVVHIAGAMALIGSLVVAVFVAVLVGAFAVLVALG
jgi:hypothetical protein